MFKPKKLSFEEISQKLSEYEKKNGYSTIEFYHQYQNGNLGDSQEMLMWAGLYHLYLTSLPIRQFMQKEISPS